MANATLNFLTEEETIKARLEGEAKGEVKVMHQRMKMSPRDIAAELELPIEEVKTIIENL